MDIRACARCGSRASSTAIISGVATYAYLDLCHRHLADLLENATMVSPTIAGSAVGIERPHLVSQRLPTPLQAARDDGRWRDRG
jgi:hypothetical protein